MTYPDAAPGQTVVLSGQLTYGAVAEGGRSLHQEGGTLLVSHHAVNGQADYQIFISSGYGGPGSEGRLVVAGVLTNESRIAVRGGLTQSGFPGIGAELSISGTLHNSGYLLLYGGGFERGYPFAGTGATLNNTGVLTNSGRIFLRSGSTDTNQYPNSGALLIDAGVLSNTGYIGIGPSYESESTPSVQPATLSVTGTLTNSGTISAIGGEEFGVGGLIQVGGVLSNAGTIALAGGEGGSRGDSGATLTLTGVLHNQGQIQLGGGGTYASSFAQGATLLDRGILTNSGTIAFTDRPTYGPNGVLEVTTAGILHNQGTITGAGTIANYGLIDSGTNALGANVLDAKLLINSGAIEVLPGASLQIDGTVQPSIGDYTHYGSIYIDAHATLTSDATRLSGQVFVFNGEKADLTVSNLSQFFGELDFARMQPAIVDLVGQQIVSAQIGPGRYSGSYLGVTYASGGTHSFYITPNSNLPSVSLHKDGHGGTNLLFIPSTGGAFPTPAQHGVLSDTPHASTSSMIELHPF